MDNMILSTHLQTLFVNADHHLCVLALHTEANTQDALLLLRLRHRQVGQPIGH